MPATVRWRHESLRGSGVGIGFDWLNREWHMQEDLPETDDERSQREDGARRLSLIAVHRPRVTDRFHDLQLARDVELINTAVRRELRPAIENPSPGKKRPVSRVVVKETVVTTKEDEVMRLSSIAAAAALAMGTLPSLATTAEKGLDDVGTSSVRSAPAGPRAVAMPHVPVSAKKAEPMLGPEYAKIPTFSAFRQKLIADGWVPVRNADCHDVVLGNDYEEICHKRPDSISCRMCGLVPEIFRSTSDGYSLMRYAKEGVPLSISVYGDVRDLDEPGRYGLVVTGWDYSESLNLFLLDQEGQ